MPLDLDTSAQSVKQAWDKLSRVLTRESRMYPVAGAVSSVYSTVCHMHGFWIHYEEFHGINMA
jgi:hypothetical protein